MSMMPYGGIDQVKDETILALARDKAAALRLWQRHQLALGLATDFINRAVPLHLRALAVIEQHPEAFDVIGDLVPTLAMGVKQILVEYVSGGGTLSLGSAPSWLED